MAQRRVLVVGAGIGGLSAAVAMRQAGWAVDVVELQPEISVSGVGIIQPSNALRALDRLGLAQACVAAGGGYPGWRLHTADGNLIAEVPNRNVAGPGMPPINGITRKALHDILVDGAIRAGATLRYDTTVSGLEDDGSGVLVGTTDGRTERYDLVLGADGVFSDLRGQLFPDAPQPRFTGEGVWRCNFPRPAEVDWGRMYYGRTSKAGLVPMSPDLMYLFLVTHEPDQPRFAPEDLPAAMRARMPDYTGLIAELRDAIDETSSVVYKPAHTLLMPLPWRCGRVLLIGDAVHATTPHLAQGASLAIEDAVLLGEMLRDDVALEPTLDAFASRRLPRARLVVEASVQLGAWEVAEFTGRPDPSADPGGLFHRAIEAMMEPI